jgi:hypothetical protein
MRFKIIPCIVAFFTVAAFGDPTTDYLAARDRYIAEFNAHPSEDAAYKRAEAAAISDLDSKIKQVIPPWHPEIPFFGGGINLTILHQELGFGTLDGLLYTWNGAEVLITTPALARHWIADHNRGASGADVIPQPIEAAIRTGQFWTYAFYGDSGTFFFGEVPVKIPRGTGVVFLAVPTQTGIPDDGPNQLLAVVLRDDRVFIARQPLGTSIPQQNVCKQLLWKPGTDEQTDHDFQVCFAPYLHEQPKYDAIRKQAQALVDQLR